MFNEETKTKLRKACSLEMCVSDMKRCYSDKNYMINYGTSALECSFLYLSNLYPEVVENTLKECIKEYGKLDGDLFDKYDTENISMIKPVLLKLNAIEDYSYNDYMVDEELSTGVQSILDTIDPEMFVFEKAVNYDGYGTFIAKKVKPGKSKVVDMINSMDDKVCKCKISSEQLVITVFENTIDKFLDGLASYLETLLEDGKNEVNKTVDVECQPDSKVVTKEVKVNDTSVNNTMYSQLEMDIAAQYGMSVEELKQKMNSQEGMEELNNKKNELIRENTNDPKVQALPRVNKEEILSKIPKLKKEEPEKSSQSEINMNWLIQSFNNFGIRVNLEKGLQGLYVARLSNGQYNLSDIAFDLDGKLFGKDMKWSPIIPETAQDAKEIPWFAIQDYKSWNMMISYLNGSITLEQVVRCNDMDIVLYDNTYREIDKYINLNQLTTSSLLKDVPNNQKAKLYDKLVSLVRNERNLLDVDCKKCEPNSYFRLYRYTDENNFVLYSDGNTRNWLNNNKPLPVEKCIALTYNNGKWELSDGKELNPKKEETKTSKESKKEDKQPVIEDQKVVDNMDNKSEDKKENGKTNTTNKKDIGKVLKEVITKTTANKKQKKEIKKEETETA